MNWQGRIEKISTTDDGSTYTATGVIEIVDKTRLRITELPIYCWTSDYRDFLESFCRWQLKDETQKLPIEVVEKTMLCK
jgi:DNA topoisomerase-2